MRLVDLRPEGGGEHVRAQTVARPSMVARVMKGGCMLEILGKALESFKERESN